MPFKQPTSSVFYGLLLAVIVILALLPLIGAIAAGTIGNMAGCRVDEAGSYPCIVLGMDIGDTLSVLFVMGWLMFVTIPIGSLLFLVWLVALVVHLARRRKKRN